MPTNLASVLASSSDSGASSLLSFGVLLLIPFALYFLMIRPQRRRIKDQAKLQSSLEVDDEVITTSGIYGRITGEDGPNRFWIEVDDDVQIRVARAAIQGKVPDEATDESDASDATDTTSESAADD